MSGHQNSIEKLLANTSDNFKHNSMQIAAFKILNTDTTFGINVNKVISFIGWEDCGLSLNAAGKSKLMLGFVNVRGKTYPLVSFEAWIGLDYDITKYKNVILCEFNNITIAFPVKSIQRIYNKSSNELETSEMLEGKISYITYIEKEGGKFEKLAIKLSRLKRRIKLKNLQKKELTDFSKEKRNKEIAEIASLENEIRNTKSEKQSELCLVFDVESLISEIFNMEQSITNGFSAQFKQSYTKRLLIAEDSKAAVAIFKKIFEGSGLSYSVYHNGMELFNALKNMDISQIGLVISDIEMPEVDGFTLLRMIKTDFPSIPVIMNSSMSNNGVYDKVKSLGAEGFIPKTDPAAIVAVVNKYC